MLHGNPGNLTEILTGVLVEESPACSSSFWISSNAASKKEPVLAEAQELDVSAALLSLLIAFQADFGCPRPQRRSWTLLEQQTPQTNLS